MNTPTPNRKKLVYCTQKGLAYINLKFGKNQNNIPQLAKIK